MTIEEYKAQPFKYATIGDYRGTFERRIAVYGISRTRDKKGAIIKQTTLPWVNCIHRNCGGGWKTMEILVLEVYDEDDSPVRRLQP